MSGIEIDHETADRITVSNLKNQLDLLKKQVKDHEKRGQYMHAEDYDKAKTKLIPSFKLLIEYFGDSSE